MGNEHSGSGEGRAPDAVLDLRGVRCPMNYVRASLQLEAMAPGQVLELWLSDGLPMAHVPNSLQGDGHLVVPAVALPDRSGFRLFVHNRKNADDLPG